MKGVAKVVLFQGLTYGLQVVFMLLAARWLGPAGQGRYALYRTGVYLTEAFMWFGLTAGIPYFIAKDFSKYHNPIMSTCLAYIALLVVSASATVRLSAALLGIDTRAGILLVVWVSTLALSQLFMKVFLGQKRFDVYNYGNLFGVFVLFIAFWAYKSVRPVHLEEVILSNIWSNFGILAFAVVAHRNHLVHVRPFTSVQGAMVKELYSVGLLGYLSSLAFLALYRTDFFFVGYFLSSRALGIYAVSVLIVEAFQKVPDWLGMILSPKVASGLTEGREITRRYAMGSLAFILLIAAAVGILTILKIDLVALILGDQYSDAQRTVLWLMPRAILHSVMVIYAGNLAGRGYSMYHPASGIGATVVLVIVDLLLVPTWGVRGAVVGITLAYACATALMGAGYRLHGKQPVAGVQGVPI